MTQPMTTVIWLISIGTACSFLPVPGVHVLDEMSGVYQDGMYVARQTFQSPVGEAETLRLCRLTAEAAGLELKEPCPDTMELIPFAEETYAHVVIGELDDFLWSATVREYGEKGGCSGHFMTAFPQKPNADLPEVGTIYPSGKIDSRMITKTKDKEFLGLVISTVDAPAIVLPYVAQRLAQNGWRAHADLALVTHLFGKGNQGALYNKDRNSLMVFAVRPDPQHWTYFFKMQRILSKGR